MYRVIIRVTIFWTLLDMVTGYATSVTDVTRFESLVRMLPTLVLSVAVRVRATPWIHLLCGCRALSHRWGLIHCGGRLLNKVVHNQRILRDHLRLLDLLTSF